MYMLEDWLIFLVAVIVIGTVTLIKDRRDRIKARKLEQLWEDRHGIQTKDTVWVQISDRKRELMEVAAVVHGANSKTIIVRLPNGKITPIQMDRIYPKNYFKETK